MNQGPETRFIASIHRLLHPSIYRMKNHNSYIGGPADVWYSGTMGDAWIEYKYVEKLPEVVDLLNRKKDYCLSALQEEWLRDRHEEGRRVFVVLGYRQGGVIFKQRQWEKKQNFGWGGKAATIVTHDRLGVAKWIAMLTKGSYEAPPKRGKHLERCV